MSRLLLVSNRLPVTVERTGSRPRVQPQVAGGLVAGLGPVHDEGQGLWFGTLNDADDPEVVAALAARRFVPVPLDDTDARGHYGGYSNGIVWPLFHYLQERVDFSPQDWSSYRKVNEIFADAIAAKAQPGDRIWVHDYHFLLLPSLLRERLPETRIGFFLHIPFPSSEVLRLLPQREEILRGLLGADLIGLHTYDYARHLVSSFRRVAGVEFEELKAHVGHICRVGVFPMGIDVSGMRQRLASDKMPGFIQRSRRQLQGRRVILGVDRLDYTKGLLLKLDAYRHLLKTRPIWRTGAVLIQIANPTRGDLNVYKDLKQRLDQRVGEINGAFATEGIVPIHYLYRSYSPEDLAAFYRLADVALVTPIRDGMNLVAKEYVACRTDDTGALVLSEFAGAASEMGEAFQVNPWDIEGCAEAIHAALCLEPDDQARRMKALRGRVESSDVRRWVQRFLHALSSASAEPVDLRDDNGPDDWVPGLKKQAAAARSTLLLLDYDGTLVPLAPRPELAAPDAEVLELLRRLGRSSSLRVAIVSGRPRHTLADWLGDIGVDLIAEHGFVIRRPGAAGWEEIVSPTDFSWMNTVRDVLAEFAARTSGSFVEEKPSALAWHYRQVESGFGEWQARELANHLSEAFPHGQFEVLHGSKVVEVRHQGIHKGAALAHLVDDGSPPDLILMAGDDRTDEHMFETAPPSAWTIKIGDGSTQARYRLASPRDLRSLLTELANSIDERPGSDDRLRESRH